MRIFRIGTGKDVGDGRDRPLYRNDMLDISNFGKILIFLGVILISAGILFMFGAKIPWLGKLPGDIYIKKENFTFYFPLATSILLSIALSIIMLFIGRKS
mgnify:CR=1 FL=1